MKQESLVQALQDAGCPDEFIGRFLQAKAHGCAEEQLRLLSCQRCKQLEQVHLEQKKLDCLDYLRYRLQHAPAPGPLPKAKP